MSGILGRPSVPVMAPVPPNPVNDRAAEQQRLEAERAALADRRARGRASTIAGGLSMETAQMARGAERQQQRFAARELLG